MKREVHPDSIPYLVLADEDGNIFDHPHLRMAGRSGKVFHPIFPEDLIPLPEGSELFVLPGRIPVGWDMGKDEMVATPEGPNGEKVYSVAAFMSPAHTQVALPAYLKEDNAQPLPLFAYTAVGWWKDRFWVAGFRSDPDRRQDVRLFNPKKIISRTKRKLKEYSQNRLIQHLGKCCLTYGCPAAKNFFLERFEAPLPTSTACNAQCIGCLSYQPNCDVPSTQERMKFIPTVEEICEVAVPHLKNVKWAIASFGQGCEGEPLMNPKLLEKAVTQIKKSTTTGTLNLNTNASRPEAVERLRRAGLDSIRISMNSVRSHLYEPYYRPKGYSQDDCFESWKRMKELGGFVSLNLFIMPGITDEIEEIERLSVLIEKFGLDLIQLRNHNIDPDWYLDSINYEPSSQRAGVKGFVKILKKKFPKLRFGYFNPPLWP